MIGVARRQSTNTAVTTAPERHQRYRQTRTAGAQLPTVAGQSGLRGRGRGFVVAGGPQRPRGSDNGLRDKEYLGLKVLAWLLPPI